MFIYSLNYLFYLYVLLAGWSAINWQPSLKIYNDVWMYRLELNRHLYNTCVQWVQLYKRECVLYSLSVVICLLTKQHLISKFEERKQFYKLNNFSLNSNISFFKNLFIYFSNTHAFLDLYGGAISVSCSGLIGRWFYLKQSKSLE